MKEFSEKKSESMNAFWSTVIAAIILVGLAILALAIGYLLTGKVRLKKKCGWEPKSGSCSICKKKECEDKDDNDDKST